jgi:hypothetical protein
MPRRPSATRSRSASARSTPRARTARTTSICCCTCRRSRRRARTSAGSRTLRSSTSSCPKTNARGSTGSGRTTAASTRISDRTGTPEHLSRANPRVRHGATAYGRAMLRISTWSSPPSSAAPSSSRRRPARRPSRSSRPPTRRAPPRPTRPYQGSSSARWSLAKPTKDANNRFSVASGRSLLYGTGITYRYSTVFKFKRVW